MVTLSQLGAQKELRDPLQGDVLLAALQGTQIWCLWTWRMLEVPANPLPLLPRSLSHPIPAGMALPRLLVLFLPPFPLFLLSSSWLSIFHWQLDCREKFLSWLPPVQGTTILLRRETLVLLHPGRAPTLPWAEFLVALGTAAWPQEQGYCTTSAVGCCFLHLTAPPNCNTSDLCCSTFA